MAAAETISLGALIDLVVQEAYRELQDLSDLYVDVYRKLVCRLPAFVGFP